MVAVPTVARLRAASVQTHLHHPAALVAVLAGRHLSAKAGTHNIAVAASPAMAAPRKSATT